MIDHLAITVSNIKNSKAFYLKALGALGYVLIRDTPTSVSFGIQKGGHGKSADPGGDFWLSEGVPPTPRVHFAFSASSRIIVDRFFADGLSAGGIDNGAPNLRTHYHSNYYAAFLLDPDGYNIEAVCHSASKR
ncbi:MAG: VOC family protein [Marinosulfonomonas sp.]|nr:VOC family protein [Marinosulfonomonas sp.]